MKKTTTTLILAAMLSASAAFAQQKMDTMKTMDMTKKPVTEGTMAPMAQKDQKTHKAVGVVKKVDSKAGVVTLAHEAINSLNWPPMTMGFMVTDKMLMDKLTVGKKVNFEFIQTADGYVVTAVK